MAINTTKFREAEYPHLSIPDTHLNLKVNTTLNLRLKEDAQEDIKNKEVISKK